MKSVDTFHQSIQEALHFPPYYGKNLDALWDCLTTLNNMPVTLVWENYGMSKTYLGTFAEKALAALKEAQHEKEGFIIRIES